MVENMKRSALLLTVGLLAGLSAFSLIAAYYARSNLQMAAARLETTTGAIPMVRYGIVAAVDRSSRSFTIQYRNLFDEGDPLLLNFSLTDGTRISRQTLVANSDGVFGSLSGATPATFNDIRVGDRLMVVVVSPKPGEKFIADRIVFGFPL